MPKVKARVGVGKRAIGNVRETKRCVAAVMKQRDECAMRIYHMGGLSFVCGCLFADLGYFYCFRIIKEARMASGEHALWGKRNREENRNIRK
jgi:hypothetical protein